MNVSSQFAGLRSFRRALAARVETLESRELLATTATIPIGFNGPDVHGLGRTAIVDTMQNALQTQVTNGALLALRANTMTPADFSTGVSNVATNFQTNVDAQLLPHFKKVDAQLKGQAQSLILQINALDLQLNDGLIDPGTFTTEATSAVAAITGGPLHPTGTPLSGFAAATAELETQLDLLPPTLADGATPSLTLAQVQAIALADAQAYQTPVNTALFTQPKINAKVDTAINTFETSVAAISTTAATTPAQQLTAAITALDTALLDTDGLFGPKGPLRK